MPLLLVPLLAVFLPEAARLLALRGAGSGTIAATLGRVTGHRFSGNETFVSNEPPVQARKPIGVLFSRGYGVTTVALWVTYFMGLLVIYLLTGWLPTIMKDAGLSIAAAANVTALFQIGGTVGAVVVGWAMDKARPAFVIAAAYAGGGLCVLALSQLGVVSPALAALVFSVGFCMSGAQTGLNAFAPGCYPTMARATGVTGLVIEAGVRDVAAPTAMRFPVWSKAVSAQGTVKKTLGVVNVPVVRAGQLVRPGDLVVADDDGVAVVPRLAAADVLRAAEVREQKKAATRARLQAGELGLDIYGMRDKLAAKGLTYQPYPDTEG